MEYLAIDWSYRRAAWCSLSQAGVIVGERAVPADADGLAGLVIERGLSLGGRASRRCGLGSSPSPFQILRRLRIAPICSASSGGRNLTCSSDLSRTITLPSRTLQFL